MKCLMIGWVSYCDNACVKTAGLAGNFIRMGSKSPLNPVLGETCQGEMIDGSKFYAEQISHHPPISSFQLDDEKYTVHGFCEFKAGLKSMNTLKASRDGKETYIFHDSGDIIEGDSDPGLEIKGLVAGAKVINFYGIKNFHDKTHNIRGEVVIAPDKKSHSIGNKLKFWKKSDVVRPHDTIIMNIYDVSNPENHVSIM